MKKTLSNLSRSVLDLLFPLNCVVCGREGQFLCVSGRCEAALPKLEKPYCSTCAKPESGALCDWCAVTPTAIDGISAPYIMTGAVQDMVYGLKYRNIRAAAPQMGLLLAVYLKSRAIPADVLIPVPLHKRRQRERGYNQSELLAREVSKGVCIPLETLTLLRTENTPPQVSMSGIEERRRNIEGAFECAMDMAGRNVLLVDDVVTTGSTMFACAAALKTARAVSVWGLALARQG